jgi:Putative undecaprenyl diphosphate synthase
LYAPEMPDPDLVIRTSGEFRLSNLLVWEVAYSELVFTDVLWPDFRREHLAEAVREFQRRDRRFGGSRAGSRDATSASRRVVSADRRATRLSRAAGGGEASRPGESNGGSVGDLTP